MNVSPIQAVVVKAVRVCHISRFRVRIRPPEGGFPDARRINPAFLPRIIFPTFRRRGSPSPVPRPRKKIQWGNVVGMDLTGIVFPVSERAGKTRKCSVIPLLHREVYASRWYGTGDAVSPLAGRRGCTRAHRFAAGPLARNVPGDHSEGPPLRAFGFFPRARKGTPRGERLRPGTGLRIAATRLPTGLAATMIVALPPSSPLCGESASLGERGWPRRRGRGLTAVSLRLGQARLCRAAGTAFTPASLLRSPGGNVVHLKQELSSLRHCETAKRSRQSVFRPFCGMNGSRTGIRIATASVRTGFAMTAKGGLALNMYIYYKGISPTPFPPSSSPK